MVLTMDSEISSDDGKAFLDVSLVVEGARFLLSEALDRAGQRGKPGWIPYFERLAARKGLSLERSEP